jgi:hypothetical protein
MTAGRALLRLSRLPLFGKRGPTERPRTRRRVNASCVSAFHAAAVD